MTGPVTFERRSGVPTCESALKPTGQITIAAVECGLGDAGWGPASVVAEPAVVFLRAGAVARRSGHGTTVHDASLAYFEYPGDEYALRHLGQGGHSSTVLTISSEVAAELMSPAFRPTVSSFPTSPEVDLYHRRLLASAARGHDAFCTDDLIALLTSCIRDALVAPRPGGRRPGTARSRQRAVNIAREIIATAPAGANLTELAAAASFSPHHLSRVFREETGTTLGRHRNRVRIRLALNRLQEPGADLSTVAHEFGFADHAHFTRTMRAELGETPRCVRALLQGGACGPRKAGGRPPDTVFGDRTPSRPQVLRAAS